MSIRPISRVSRGKGRKGKEGRATEITRMYIIEHELR